MRKFYSKITIFLLLLALFLGTVDYISMVDPWRKVLAKYTDSEEFISVNVGVAEIKPYIEKVQTKDDTTILIIGDSVCKQMFDGLQQYNEDMCITGSNAAIAMTGQYILARKYIENHPGVTDVYMFLLPGSLRATFDTQWGYQYTVMPFVETDTLKLLDNNTIEAMESVYSEFFMRPLVVEWIDKSAINRKLYLNMLDDTKEGYQQKTSYEIAEQYIKKIYDLCQENDIELHLYPCPVVESQRTSIENMKEEYTKTWLYTKFPDYLDKVLFYPDEQARDGVHFGGDYASQKYYNEKIKIIFEGAQLLEKLCFE